MKSSSLYSLKNVILLVGILVAIFIGITSVLSAKSPKLNSPEAPVENVTKSNNARLIQQYGSKFFELVKKTIQKAD